MCAPSDWTFGTDAWGPSVTLHHEGGTDSILADIDPRAEVGIVKVEANHHEDYTLVEIPSVVLAELLTRAGWTAVPPSGLMAQREAERAQTTEEPPSTRRTGE